MQDDCNLLVPKTHYLLAVHVHICYGRDRTSKRVPGNMREVPSHAGLAWSASNRIQYTENGQGNQYPTGPISRPMSVPLLQSVDQPRLRAKAQNTCGKTDQFHVRVYIEPVRKPSTRSAISSAAVSSAKWPPSTICTCALGTSRRNASGSEASNERSYFHQITRKSPDGA